MSQAQRYELWFDNQSLAGGQAVVYQSLGNVTFSGSTLDQLAWMVTGANPSVLVRFSWSVDYAFVWVSESPSSASQQILPADLQTANRVVLSHNQNGFLFSPPQAATPAGSLLITEDTTVPTVSDAVAGIGMSSAGTFATPARPNTNLSFTPASLSSLTYQITFGSYDLEVGAILTVSGLNPPGTVVFPQGVTAMTATLSAANTWSVVAGAPTRRLSHFIDYRAGIGVVSSSEAGSG